MKTAVLLGVLLTGAVVGTSVGTSASAPANAQGANAQDALVAPPFVVETSVAKVLTAAFVKSCIYIGSGTFEAKAPGEANVPGETLGTFRYKGYARFKGADGLRVRGLIVPSAALAVMNRDVIVFARFDGISKRGVVAATLPMTPQNTARVQALVAATPTLSFSVEPSKTRYALNEPVIITWKIKNISGAALSISTGQDATDVSLLYGGSSRSSSDAQARRRPLTTRLQNGETWEYARTYDSKFPVGRVGIKWFYSGDRVLDARGPLPGDLYLEYKTGDSSFEVAPATSTQQAELLAGLKSPLWTQQREAARSLLLSPDSTAWEKVEAFASHPDPQLRELAAQALIRKGGFPPALKQLLYEGTRVDWEPDHGMGDFALAVLASNAVEAEARQAGITGERPSPLVYGPEKMRDPRVGDILAARLSGADPRASGPNNGIALYLICGLRDPLRSFDEPLPEAIKTKTLAAWKLRRASVANPFTLAQLNAEIARVRQVRYDNFSKGPFYEQVAAIVDDGEKLNFNASADMDKVDARIAALPRAAVPTLFQVLKRHGIQSPPLSALRLLADSGAPNAFVTLAQIAYGRNEGNVRVEAIRLMAKLDFKRARPHLEAFLQQPFDPSDWSLEAPRLGAALVLASRGEERAVPVFFSAPFERSLTFLNDQDVSEALHAATGLNYPNVKQWREWWEREGSQQAWK